MRLLDTVTGQFKSFNDPRTVRYAILSHVWAQPNSRDYIPEQTYQEIVLIQTRHPDESILHRLRPKIRNACRIARDHDFHYIWIDAGCIDKSSSAELSQAINSMFHWYRHATICYVYLDDVDDSESDVTHKASRFRVSRWFTRGWTLQELIAPHDVIFLSKGWKVIGTKSQLADVIRKVTLIDCAVLRGEKVLEEISVAARISWPSKRETTMEEDEAYCLLGIFGVHMASMYGEGRNAFIRLQKAILTQTADPTILAWGHAVPMGGDLVFDNPKAPPFCERRTSVPESLPLKSYLLALRPRDFEDCGAFDRDCNVLHTEFTPTAHGIRTRLQVLQIYHNDGSSYLLALLGCKDRTGRHVTLLLEPQFSPAKMLLSVIVGAHLAGKGTRAPTISEDESAYCRLVLIDDAIVQAHRDALVQEMYIPHHLPPSLVSRMRNETIHQSLGTYGARALGILDSGADSKPGISLAGWCTPLLRKRGYIIKEDSGSHSYNVDLEEEHAGCRVNIRVGYCERYECRERGLLSASVTDTRTPGIARLPEEPFFRPACQDHINSWKRQHCVACKDFPFRSSISEVEQTLRLTIRLTLTGPEKNAQQKLPTYILGIELLGPPNNRKRLANKPESSIPAKRTFRDDAPPGVVDSGHRETTDAYPGSSGWPKVTLGRIFGKSSTGAGGNSPLKLLTQPDTPQGSRPMKRGRKSADISPITPIVTVSTAEESADSSSLVKKRHREDSYKYFGSVPFRNRRKARRSRL